MSPLTVVQLNTRASSTVWELLGVTVRQMAADIVLVQDPPRNCKWACFWGYSIVTPTDVLPQVAILIRQNIPFRPVLGWGPRVVGLTIERAGDVFAVLSAYIRHTSGLGVEDLSRALYHVADVTPHVLLGADCNGHSPLWGPRGTVVNKVGSMVEEVLGEGGLLVLNKSNAPASFFSDAGHQAWIDISAASPSVVHRVTGWAVHPDLEVGSDHRVISWTLEVAAAGGAPRVSRNWAKVDWRDFNRALLSLLDPSQCHGDILDAEELEEAVNLLTQRIQRTIEHTVPERRVCQFSRPWWTPELTALRRQMAMERRHWVRSGRVVARERFLRSRSAFRRALVQAKLAAWHRLCDGSSTADFWALYRRLRREGSAGGVEDLELGGCVESSDAGKAEALASAFFPSLPSGDRPRQLAIEHAWSTYRPPGLLESERVTRGEVILAIRDTRADAAPGPDGIPARVFKKCMMTLLPWLVWVFQGSLVCGHYPLAWRTAKVIALRKPGKASYATPRSYRPISLLPVMGKLLERLVNRRLMRQLESRCLLSPYQFGFRAGRDTLMACDRLVEDAVSAFRRRLQVQVVALDIKSAFDTVWQAGLVHKLQRMGVSGYLLSWVRGFLTDRVSVLEVGTARVEVRPECGVPQGSPISSTLFLVYIDDLLRIQHRIREVRFQAFADDNVLWAVGNFRDGVVHRGLQLALEATGRWAAFWRIELSVSKCESILLRDRRISIRRTFQPRLCGQVIPAVEVLRYLGVWFDRCLTWGQQVHEATSAARQRLWALRRCLGRDWGLDPHIFLQVVRRAILPRLFYGASCWASALSSSTRLAELDSVLAAASKMAFRLERNTSTEAALALAGLHPARHQIMRLLCRYMVRRERATLFDPSPPRIPTHHVSAHELGRAWFRRSVLGRTLSESQPQRWRVITSAIDRALLFEWRVRWRTAATGAALREAFPVVGHEWRPVDAGVGDRLDLTVAARFLVGHCHLGSFRVPWDEDEWEPCPLCGEDFTRAHLVWECRAVTQEREHLLGSAGSVREGDWRWLARFRGSRLGGFVRSVSRLVERSGVVSDRVS